jgi:hypothetical protein
MSAPKQQRNRTVWWRKHHHTISDGVITYERTTKSNKVNVNGIIVSALLTFRNLSDFRQDPTRIHKSFESVDRNV